MKLPKYYNFLNLFLSELFSERDVINPKSAIRTNQTMVVSVYSEKDFIDKQPEGCRWC